MYNGNIFLQNVTKQSVIFSCFLERSYQNVYSINTEFCLSFLCMPDLHKLSVKVDLHNKIKIVISSWRVRQRADQNFVTVIYGLSAWFVRLSVTMNAIIGKKILYKKGIHNFRWVVKRDIRYVKYFEHKTPSLSSKDKVVSLASLLLTSCSWL